MRAIGAWFLFPPPYSPDLNPTERPLHDLGIPASCPPCYCVKVSFWVEQCFGTMKRLFGLHRARYFGRARTHAQLAMAAIGQNLLKARTR